MKVEAERGEQQGMALQSPIAVEKCCVGRSIWLLVTLKGCACYTLLHRSILQTEVPYQAVEPDLVVPLSNTSQCRDPS